MRPSREKNSKKMRHKGAKAKDEYNTMKYNDACNPSNSGTGFTAQKDSGLAESTSWSIVEALDRSVTDFGARSVQSHGSSLA